MFRNRRGKKKKMPNYYTSAAGSTAYIIIVAVCFITNGIPYEYNNKTCVLLSLLFLARLFTSGVFFFSVSLAVLLVLVYRFFFYYLIYFRYRRYSARMRVERM